MNSTSFCDFQVLRELRKRAGLTMEEVAEKSGVHAGVISKLERNRNKPELETLNRIAGVFGLSLSDLISLAENRSVHPVREEQYPSGGFQFRRVIFEKARCMLAEAPAGAELSRPELHRDDYELCWVLSGKLALLLPDEEYLLKAGEAIQFDALLTHTCRALTDVRILLVHIRKGKMLS